LAWRGWWSDGGCDHGAHRSISQEVAGANDHES
jgi:hypothetical protein